MSKPYLLGIRHTVLSNGEFGEDAAQKAYKIALEDEHLPAYLRQMIEQQKQKFKESHDEIKALRDQEKNKLKFPF